VLEWIRDRDHLRRAQQEHSDFLVLAFWGEFSSAAQRALAELEEFSREQDHVPVYVVDVEEVPGLHKEFAVERVPTVLALEKDKVTRSTEGVQSARFYAVHFAAPDDGWAAGQAVYHFDGKTWNHIPVPEGFHAFDVFTLGGDEVWLAGFDRKIYKYAPEMMKAAP